MYSASVAVHVVAAIVGFGATFTYPVIQIVAERADRRSLPTAMATITSISRWVAVPATGLVGATGAYQVGAGPFTLGAPWLIAGLVLYLAVMAAGILWFAPAYRRAEEAARRMVAAADDSERIELSQEYRAALRGPVRAGPLVAVGIIAIAVLMETKPG